MPFSPAPRLLVFDLDGTLIDSRTDLANSVNAMLTQFERPTLEDATIGDGVAALVRRGSRSIEVLRRGDSSVWNLAAPATVDAPKAP